MTAFTIIISLIFLFFIWDEDPETRLLRKIGRHPDKYRLRLQQLTNRGLTKEDALIHLILLALAPDPKSRQKIRKNIRNHKLWDQTLKKLAET
ncbi:MAG: hypothetical protein DRN14_08000 [Thermoplasmata archaeon]|nr:MAG: hypothetical protein DRN14_08000 [Thermoplasmata archaeon]